jgi:hypothetical protein
MMRRSRLGSFRRHSKHGEQAVSKRRKRRRNLLRKR